MLSSDIDVCNTADYILSIVPQRDASSIADRVISAVNDKGFARRTSPLYFLDLNAVSPHTARAADERFASSAPDVRMIDGGIIGGPPRRKEDGTWYRPSIVVSGRNDLREAKPDGGHLAELLNVQHVNDQVGSASGLKMCFAALSKGFTALALQSFTTAHNLGVVPELQQHLREYSPALGDAAQRTLPNMPPKAYRWVQEMVEIAETFEQDGGFSKEESIFRPIGAVYGLVADGTELGKEKSEDRQRGRTAVEVATLTSEGIERRKKA